MIFWFTLIVKKKKVIASYMKLGRLPGFAQDFYCHLRVSPSLCFYVSISLLPTRPTLSFSLPVTSN